MSLLTILIVMSEDADNFYDDDDYVDESRNDNNIMEASTHRVVKQLWKKKNIFFDLPY